jgi:nucleoside-diphosphate-sugar epimerase
MTRALVLGGTGFLGQAACKELMRRGVETIAASRTAHPYGTFTSHRAFDRRDEAQLRRVLDEVRPDVLLDLACYQPADVEAVIGMFRGDRYVFVSTGVYPPLHGRPAREDDFVPLDGEPPGRDGLEYFEGKRWCETLLARTEGFPSTVIRPPAILGAGDRTLRVAAYIERVADGGPLLVPAESYTRQAGLAWVRDVGYACALACDPRKPATGRVYNVAFDGVTLSDLILSIGRAMGRQPELVPIPYVDLPEGASPYGPNPERSAGYVLDRARRELGFEPSALEDAIAETLAWYQVERPSHPGYEGRPRELELAARVRR